MNRIVLVLGLATTLVLAGTAGAQDGPKPIRVTLNPVAPVRPVLRYRLLPELIEMKHEDAVKLYAELVELLKTLKDKADLDALQEDIQDVPLQRLPREKMRQALAHYDKAFALVDRAARCETCDWDISDRIREKGIGALLPEIQQLRQNARLLQLRCRLQTADGDIDGALRTVRTGMGMARHVGETPTLISHLVGVAIASIFLAEVDQILSQPNCPNLYWALTDLPQPLLSMRKPLEGERLWAYGTFPGLARFAADPSAPPLTEKEVEAIVKATFGLNDGKDNLVQRHLLAANIRLHHDTAKQALIDAGWPKEKVESWPHVQVALLHSLQDYQGYFDELVKTQNFPYPDASKQLAELDKQLRARRANRPATAPAIPLVELLLPAINKVRLAQARTERKIAALRCVEAIRLYAAKHDGKLPESLDDIKEVPVPIDPILGKPFQYKLHGERMVRLMTTPPPEGKNNPTYTLIYDLRLPDRKP
jgi:hypothetical protein